MRNFHGIGKAAIKKPENPLKCEQCEHEFRSYDGLRTHMLKVQKIFNEILIIEWSPFNAQSPTETF